MRERYSLCLIMGLGLIYLALPYLTFEGTLKQTIFCAAWLCLALFSAAGNLAGILYGNTGKPARLKKKEDEKKRLYMPQ